MSSSPASNFIGLQSSAATPELQPTRAAFQRSYSRVFYESDYSTPTSWEFCGLAAAQAAAAAEQRQMSLQSYKSNNMSSGNQHTPTSNLNLTVYQQQSPIQNLAHSIIHSNNNNSSSENSNGELQADGTRNSTGSSTGSHRSQDSGFSDAGETRRKEKLLHLSRMNDSSSNKSQQQNNVHHRSKSLNQTQILECLPMSPCEHNSQSCYCNHQEYHDLHLSLPVPPLPTNQPPVSVVINGTPSCFYHCHCSVSEEAYNGCDNGGCGCEYGEIIEVKSPTTTQGRVLLQEVQKSQEKQHQNEIGAPTCCSTPKKSTFSPSFTPSRMTVMQKIDNFESLNKNINMAKILDNNNNSNNNCTNNSSNNNETRSSFFSRPPSRIPTPPPNMPSSSFLQHEQSIIINNNNESLSPSILNSQLKTNSFKTVISNNGSNIPESHLREYGSETETSLSLLCRLSPKLNDVSNYNYDSSQFKLFTKTSPKWKTLPKGFKRIHTRDNNAKKEIIVKSHFDNDAVRLWLHELRVHTEPESFHTLQVKDLNSSSLSSSDSELLDFNSPRQQQQHSCTATTVSIPAHLVSAPLLSIRKVERTAALISGEFSRICKYLEFKLYEQVVTIIFNLLENIEDFINSLKESIGYLTKLEQRLLNACSELRMATLRLYDDVRKDVRPMGLSTLDRSTTLTFSGLFDDNNTTAIGESPREISNTNNNTNNNGINNAPVVSAVLEGIVKIGNQFSQVVDQKLTKDLSAILDVIESGGFGARVALESFSIVLYDGGMHLSRLASNIRTVRGLLSCILETREESEQILALRCLATVLCVGEAVKSFDKAGGFEIIADILHDSGLSIIMKCEAVAVLTQVTDPWIDLEASLCNLGPHLEKIVVSLTRLIPYFLNEPDPFLLIAAAISNLTFLELSSIQMLRVHGTIPLIIHAVQQKTDFYSVFIMDHVSTILANMAGVENCRQEIIRHNGIQILVYFLQKSPSPLDSLSEITACERLQQKSTIAISRLTTEAGVPELVLELGGIQRLVQLSKQEKERNYSDGVLIACLATLRKLVTVCGSELIQELQAEELIYPRLLDSFLLFSSRQESCV